MKTDYDFIEHQVKSSIRIGNISELYLAIQPKQKKTVACVSLEIIKRFPINELDKADKLYETIQKFHYDLERIVYGTNKKAITDSK